MKTLQEEVEDANGYPSAVMEGKRQAFHEGFMQGVEFAQIWIDVNDELPEVDVKINERYLIKSKAGVIYLSYYENGVFLSGINVTHWRPIEIK